MKDNLTELVFILDRSGSMGGLESDTIGGYNAMLSKQKNQSGRAKVTTVLFDDEYELIHERLDIEKVEPITEKQYFVRGTTALLDAIGRTLSLMISISKTVNKDAKSNKVIFVITTDGMENASVEYSYKKIKKMIEYQKEKYGWEFIFLGANIDAIDTAQRFGINKDMATNFKADSQGVSLNYEVVSEALTCFRSNKKMTKEWKKRIEEDYTSRNR